MSRETTSGETLDAEESATDVVARLEEARERLLSVFTDLDDETLIGPKQHHVEPPLWEVGHTAWFQEYWLLRHLDGRDPMIPRMDGVYDAFNVSYRLRTEHEYPEREMVLDYARAILDASAQRLDGREPTAEERYFYELATQHEYMHTENLLGVRQTLGYGRPAVLVGKTTTPVETDVELGDVTIPGGTFLLGAPDAYPFVWDNERDAHEVEIEPFAIAMTAVTNEEYRQFVDDDGYATRTHWTRRGWDWRRREGAEHPLFWRREGDDWVELSFGEPVHFDPWKPMCHVNIYEAEAYCRWAGRRLPTEAEWEMAASMGPDVTEKRMYPWGDEEPTPAHANLDWTYGDRIDVRALPAGDSAYGCRQMIGNVWEWTSSVLDPYPGFEPGPYREYSEPYLGKKPVLRGGAWVTRSRLIRNTWRNFFIRHRRNIFAGFRTCAP